MLQGVEEKTDGFRGWQSSAGVTACSGESQPAATSPCRSGEQTCGWSRGETAVWAGCEA